MKHRLAETGNPLTQPSPPGHTEITPLTGLRGIAACWVMAAHYLGTTRGPDVVRSFIDHGYIPVDIFLILSGFVLALTYQAQFRNSVTVSGTGRFLAYRLARIYPLYAVTTLVCLVQLLCGLDVWGNASASVASTAANFLLVQAWRATGHTLNAPAWSISTEWAANLLFPVLVVVLIRWRMRTAALLSAAAFLCLSASAFLFGQLGEHDPWRGAVNWYAGPAAVMRCTAEFMFGMLCWRLRTESWAVRLGSTPVLIGVLGTMWVFIVYSWQDIPLVALSCALVIGLAAERSFVSGWFGSRIPRWLGNVSFSIYLWQIPMLPLRPFAIAAATRAGAADPWLVGNLAMMAGVIGVSAASFRWLEKPSQRALRALMGRRQAA